MEWYKEDADVFEGAKEDSKWLCEVVWGELPPDLIRRSRRSTAPAMIILNRGESKECPG